MSNPPQEKPDFVVFLSNFQDCCHPFFCLCRRLVGTFVSLVHLHAEDRHAFAGRCALGFKKVVFVVVGVTNC